MAIAYTTLIPTCVSETVCTQQIISRIDVKMRSRTEEVKNNIVLLCYKGSKNVTPCLTFILSRAFFLSLKT